ncbi:PLD nuclease N-terminal domain-containing protein [Neobacillus terrae]|uniref:PLD nuclease N-terminal domain-containing protein n=1 Tax=Neobacillus terrae TaxID=3034837 RepID=UPI0014093776|nr:PLD nuclease N-terminal domain-containing protein [Neobacillus terrae]NHM29353.1 PLDc_N domain-containing protein [Neobacillus terrae]
MNQIEGINIAVLAPVLIINLILIIVAVIDLVRVENTRGPKWLWALIILFVNLIGPILYFIVGRRNN